MGKSREWLYLRRLRRDPKGPPYYKIGNRVFYLRSELAVWIETCRVAA